MPRKCILNSDETIFFLATRIFSFWKKKNSCQEKKTCAKEKQKLTLRKRMLPYQENFFFLV